MDPYWKARDIQAVMIHWLLFSPLVPAILDDKGIWHPGVLGYSLVAGVPFVVAMFVTWRMIRTPVTPKDAERLIHAWGEIMERTRGNVSRQRLPSSMPRMKEALRIGARAALTQGDQQMLTALGVGYMMLSDTVEEGFGWRPSLAFEFVQEWQAFLGQPDSPGDAAAQVQHEVDALMDAQPPGIREELRPFGRKAVRETTRGGV